MAEAEQEVDVGGPGTDPRQRRQRMMGGVGVFFGQHFEVQALGGQFARDVFQGLDLGCRQSQPAQPVCAGASDRLVVKGIEGSGDPPPDRRGARGRELLAADDMRKPDKARFAPPQGRHARNVENRPQAWILLDQGANGFLEISLCVEVGGHCKSYLPACSS